MHTFLLRWRERGAFSGDGACLDWASQSHLQEALAGSADIAYNAKWTNDFITTCGTDARLLCFSSREVLFWDGFDLSGNTERWSDVTP